MDDNYACMDPASAGISIIVILISIIWIFAQNLHSYVTSILHAMCSGGIQLIRSLSVNSSFKYESCKLLCGSFIQAASMLVSWMLLSGQAGQVSVI